MDEITRVKKTWFGVLNKLMKEPETTAAGSQIRLKELHDMHHFGQNRTLFLARNVDPSITKKAVVERCSKCQFINPTPIRHIPCGLLVEEDWTWLAIDMTHY